MIPEPEKVTKIAAAERQLREAILMFFERRDRIAIHTLAASAQQLLVDLARASGHASLLKDSPYVKAEMQEQWARRLNEPQNFFKHADRDPEAVLEFYFDITEFHLLEAVHLFRLLEGRMPSDQLAFVAWFSTANPDLLAEGPLKDQVEALLRSGVTPNNFAIFLAIAHGRFPA